MDNLSELDVSSEDDMDPEEMKEFGKQMEFEDMVLDDEDVNEFDEDYEENQIKKLDQELTQRHNEHREYQLKGRASKEDETKDQKLMRKKIEKGKRNMQLQLDNANKLELEKYNNKDVERDSSDDSEDTDTVLDSNLLKKVDKIERFNLKRQKIAEDQEFINPLVATKKDIKRMKNKGKTNEPNQKNKSDDESEIEEFESDVDDLADQLDKGKFKHLTDLYSS